MTALAIPGVPDGHTSAVGSMYRGSVDTILSAAIIVACGLLSSATAATYDQLRVIERTTAGPTGQLNRVSTESTAEAILEIRRRSGLTWEELGDLFDVSRRSVHHWASGKAVSAKNDEMIRRMLAAVRHFDQGDQAATRARLMTVDDATGMSLLDSMKAGRLQEAMATVEGLAAADRHRIPLSRHAQEARRPAAPADLLEADQRRPDIPAKARTVRPARTRNQRG